MKKKLVKKIHRLVDRFLPEDDLMDLVDALFAKTHQN